MPALFCSLCGIVIMSAAPAETRSFDIHQYLLDVANRLEKARQARFAAVKTKSDLKQLQHELRTSFLRLLGGLPEHPQPPAAKITCVIRGDGYVIEKLLYESWPGYYVPALLYKPNKISNRLPAILSPCGHAAVGKAFATYQIMHINLAKRGYIVLTYDPVGQGERSQFWDPVKKKSRFNLACGEHAVLGNPLYLLGTSLARYRIWDGIRGIDYLAALPEVDRARIGCVGNSGGGTLTAYIAALDSRVQAAAICCYITTLPRRMANRIQTDPDSDPEQDIFEFVSAGIDHAGLLALRAPRPTLIGSARLDFFPIEGARESYAEAKKLYAVAGAAERITQVEADAKHGLTLPLRLGVYAFFDRWLAGSKNEADHGEFKVTPRSPQELRVCADGQVNAALGSRHLLTLALAEFDRKSKPPRKSLTALLRLDPVDAHFTVTELNKGASDNRTLIVWVNGNEGPEWQREKKFLDALTKRGYAVVAVDPRGVGNLRPNLSVSGRSYTDPLAGVEANVAYNAFLVGKSLVGMRVADVQEAVRKLVAAKKWSRVIVCGRKDAALVACLTAAIEPAISDVAVEDMPLTWRMFFDPAGKPINAAGILPNALRDYGDIGDILAAIAPRPLLSAAGRGKSIRELPNCAFVDREFSSRPTVFLEWLNRK